ncbi:hypothetical protein OG762_35540 [Streptomyces sp. NBC_01136]|uniref:hypothetical protein n=1 Tax=unclassified Streptomyces TaxID=2593676 RepID=UPI0032516091|nr:hypothetical protein OG762_35540 [Streptomyces sp. NBC_01136]
MAQTYEKQPTMLSHGELPYPMGTLVEDTLSKRTGELHGVIEERIKEGNKVISRTAYLRPEGGGTEWDVPLARIRPVESH